MDRTPRHTGVALAAGAYLIWGLTPIFYKHLHVDLMRVLAHRALWSGVIGALVLATLRRRALAEWWIGGDRTRALCRLALTAAILVSNWYVYIHAVVSGQVSQSSLGYFMSPLLTAALGMVFAAERPNRSQRIALFVAAAAVLQLALRAGTVPWIAIYLAASFASYGMLRKSLPLDPLVASCFESLLMVPFALGYLLLARPEALLEASPEGALLLASGAVTALPLMLFAAGAKRLRYLALGLLQYLTPSLQLLLAVLAYHEPVSPPLALTFALIWIALLVVLTAPAAATIATRYARRRERSTPDGDPAASRCVHRSLPDGARLPRPADSAAS